MLPLKLNFQGEMRRVQSFGSDMSYSNMSQIAVNIFSPLKAAKQVTFQWRDDENDLISCSSDEELREAMRVMSSENRTTFKFEILPQDDSTCPPRNVIGNSGLVEHTRVRCDGCGVKPIIGVRYKCCIRDDYDLCSHCEESSVQPHPMIKIYLPEQTPAAIFIAMEEREVNIPAWAGECVSSDHEGTKKISKKTEVKETAKAAKVAANAAKKAEKIAVTLSKKVEKLAKKAEKCAEKLAKKAKKGGAVKHPHDVNSRASCSVVDGEDEHKSELSSSLSSLALGTPEPCQGVEPANGVETANELPSQTSLANIDAVAESVNDTDVQHGAPGSTGGGLDAAGSALAVWAGVWSAELEVLAAMGFTDKERLIPMLRTHFGQPVSISKTCLDLNNLQRLLAALLDGTP